MTGYGSASGALGESTLAVQVSSVNRRSLDLAISVPHPWQSLEAVIAERVRAAVTRGRVQVDIELTSQSGDPTGAWDTAAIGAALKKLGALAAEHRVAFHPTPELLWQIASAQRRSSDPPPPEAARTAVFAALDRALHEFVIMRAKEGEALLVDLLARMTSLRRQLEAVAARAPQVIPSYRELLARRLREAGVEFDLDDDRVLKEIALFADRCDVSEELTRGRSHLDQLATLLKSEGEIGRKAEFIIQELGREVHTIGGKANDLAISRHVIEFKNELERVREQIANVE